jgi:hypothetical protein
MFLACRTKHAAPDISKKGLKAAETAWLARLKFRGNVFGAWMRVLDAR